MAAGMWRIPSSKVVVGKDLSIIQDRGVLRSAVTASNGYYLFSEVGAGVMPLALIGHWHEILNFLVRRSGSGIDNRIGDLPDVYMGMSYYRPGQRFVGHFPLHDAIGEVVKGVMAFAPGSAITDIGGGIGDMIGIGKTLFGKKKKPKKLTMASNEVYLKFSYLPEKGMAKVGSRKVSFKKLYPVVLETLSRNSGVG